MSFWDIAGDVIGIGASIAGKAMGGGSGGGATVVQGGGSVAPEGLVARVESFMSNPKTQAPRKGQTAVASAKPKQKLNDPIEIAKYYARVMD